MSSSDEESEKDVSTNAESSNETSKPTDAFTSSDVSVEQIRKLVASKLGFLDSDSDEEPVVKVLDDVSVDGIVKYIKSAKCKKIITMAGAGISTCMSVILLRNTKDSYLILVVAAGIPDFRSPGSGLYHNLQKYNLPDPQAIFELNYFNENPKPFFTLAKELYPGVFKPTASHYFIRMIHEKGLLLRHYTQNIDTLERVAGIPGEKLVEAHGTFNTGHCVECNVEYTQEWMKVKIFDDDIPICNQCPGVVKPDVIFFGENLPGRFHKCILNDFPQCDLLIILGSSLVVQPFASLVDRVNSTCPRLLINREKAGERSRLMRMLNVGGGLDFDSANNTRDVAWLGDCDELCLELANKLEWEDELKELIKTEYKRIDQEQEKQTNV